MAGRLFRTNAVTLMELKIRLIPIASNCRRRKIGTGRPDYWDCAIRLELAVLAKAETAAEATLADALPAVREAWELETTVQKIFG